MRLADEDGCPLGLDVVISQSVDRPSPSERVVVFRE